MAYEDVRYLQYSKIIPYPTLSLARELSQTDIPTSRVAFDKSKEDILSLSQSLRNISES